MPRYRVLRRVDAFVDYCTDIEAASPEEAAALANWKEDNLVWKQTEIVEFDARLFVTLNQDGCEIESSKTGDF